MTMTTKMTTTTDDDGHGATGDVIRNNYYCVYNLILYV